MFRLATFLFVLMVLPVFGRPAEAQTYYLELDAGYGQSLDASLATSGAGFGKAGFAAAPAAGIAFGFASHDGWRLEAALDWNRAEFDTVGGAAAVGEIEAMGAMFNIIYGVSTGTPVTPWLGAGGGAARVAVSGLTTPGGVVDGFDTVPAWQALAGVDVAFSESVTLVVTGRYFAADSVRIDDPAGTRLGFDLHGASAMLGLRFGF